MESLTVYVEGTVVVQHMDDRGQHHETMSDVSAIVKDVEVKLVTYFRLWHSTRRVKLVLLEIKGIKLT